MQVPHLRLSGTSARFQLMCNKGINAFGLPARRVVYLDSDAIVTANIDNLFDGGDARGDAVFRAAADLAAGCYS